MVAQNRLRNLSFGGPGGSREGSWRGPGGVLGSPGRIPEGFGGILEDLGWSWNFSGDLEGSWVDFGAILEPKMGPKIGPKRFQEGASI